MPEISIQDACRTGDIEAVRACLAADPDAVDRGDEHGWRPIFHAGLWRQEDIVRLLLDAGADLAAEDGYVLHYAGEIPNNKNIVRLLVEYGALDAHVRPIDDLQRQLLAAVFLADEARVRSLLARHPQLVNAADGRGDPPILHAARNGDTNIVRALIEHSANVNARNTRDHTVLYCAGGHGHLDTVQLLLDNGADAEARFGEKQMTLLEWLAQYPDDWRYKPIAAELQQRNGSENTSSAG